MQFLHVLTTVPTATRITPEVVPHVPVVSAVQKVLAVVRGQCYVVLILTHINVQALIHTFYQPAQKLANVTDGNEVTVFNMCVYDC